MKQIRVALLGAGYIASHHVKALSELPQVKICAICDLDLHVAELLSKQIPDSKAYVHFEEMLALEKPDVLHILTPPDQHFSAAKTALKSGCQLFIEKPICATASESEELVALAESLQKKIGVNHNMLFYHSYEQLKRDLLNRELGPLDTLSIVWRKSMNQLRNGPFESWMLREPNHLFLETAPHLLSAVVDLAGEPVWTDVRASDLVTLPNGRQVYRRWNLLGSTGPTALQVHLALSDGFDEHFIEVRGRIGYAKADYAKNCYILQRHSSSMLPFDLYKMTRHFGKSLCSQARQNILSWIFNKAKLAKRGDPYTDSIKASVKAFYDGIDARQTAQFAAHLTQMAETLSKIAPSKPPEKKSSASSAEILVIGGTGFIGQELVRQLVNSGKKVRILARDPGKINIQNLQIVKGSLTDRASIQKALEGIKVVFHLATAKAKTWQEYLDLDLAPTRLIAELCLKNSIQRLIYTSSIDVYDAGQKDSMISEKTGIDPDISSRNYYAQLKAASETLLMDMYREKNLPVTIIRPGIVLGNGSSPFHWGVGMWHYESLCQLWGSGKNPLPFVLIEDVAQGLIRAMDTPLLEGESFNLVDTPSITAQEYVKELGTALQANIRMEPTPIWQFFFWQILKWLAKACTGQRDLKPPSYHDWKSRTQRATYDCTKAQKQLHWQPTGIKETILEKGVREVGRKWWL